MKYLFGQETYGDLSDDGPRMNKYEVGDIAYWSPDHQVAGYYHTCARLLSLAKIDPGTAAFDVPGWANMTFSPVQSS